MDYLQLFYYILLEHKENEEIRNRPCHFLKIDGLGLAQKPVWLYIPVLCGGRLPAGRAWGFGGVLSHATYTKSWLFVSEPAPQRRLGWNRDPWGSAGRPLTANLWLLEEALGWSGTEEQSTLRLVHWVFFLNFASGPLNMGRISEFDMINVIKCN